MTKKGSLLARFGVAADVIDLDDPEYFAETDLAAYALACLRLDGDERPRTPYGDDTAAWPLARRIAAMSGRNFLIAGLVARSHGLHDTHPADPDRLAFDATVDAALEIYLRQLSPVAGLSAAEALTALAFAEAPRAGPDCGGSPPEPCMGSKSAPMTFPGSRARRRRTSWSRPATRPAARSSGCSIKR